MKPDDLETERATVADGGDGDSSGDSEANAMLRAIAYAPPRRPASVVVPGTKWGVSDRYTIDRRLGRGGMGSVYAATDTLLERVVALKVLDASHLGHDASYKRQLLREAKLAARVEHERIARVYDVGSHDGLGFVAMEYVQGHTLRHWMAGRQVTGPEIVDIAIQIADGLAALHGSGVIHRDLKPENVMLTAQGTVKLLDFGLARATLAPADGGTPRAPGAIDGASVTAVSGTPGYMAPEQCAGQPIDERVDVFALGVIIHELVTGERLFHGDTMGAVIQATLAWVPALRGDRWQNVPDRLREHTARMLARDPAARFEDGASVRAALSELRAEPSWHSVRLPEVVVQAGKPPTERALPRVRFAGLRQRLDRKGVVVAAGVTAAVFAAMWFRPMASPQYSPPPDMVRIDVGTITVGITDRQIDRECARIGPGCDRDHMRREMPHEVTLAPFFLDRHEVTNQQFAEVLDGIVNTLVVVNDRDDHTPRYVTRSPSFGAGVPLLDLQGAFSGIEYTGTGYRARPGLAQLPVVQVSWYGATLYCETMGRRLPTDHEWEAAARGRENRKLPWGDGPPRWEQVALPDDGRLVPVSSSSSQPEGAVPVGTSRQDVTPEGVFDLAGNVTEWTSSSAGPAQRGPQDSPETAVNLRFVRGGSWAASVMARPSGRIRRSALTMATNYGFRCAKQAVDE